MSRPFVWIMREKSDEDLTKYLVEHSKYVSEAIDAAVVELQLRGKMFSKEELARFDQIISEKYAEELKENQPPTDTYIEKLLRKFFSKKNAVQGLEKQLDNTRLVFLVNNWCSNPTEKNFNKIVEELTTGNSFLLIPVGRDLAGSETYPSGEGDLKFASVADIDGYKGIAVFTSENLLLNWAKSPCQFMKVKSQDVLTFCKTNRIDRIVIDTANRQSCILDWGYCSAGNNIIGEATSFEISIPIAPLSRRIIQKLSSHFKEVYPIKEAYQFLVKNDEVMVQAIGLHLSVDSTESRIAARNAIGRSFEGENHPFHFEVMILNDDCLRQLIPIQCTLFYKVDSV